MRRILGLAVVGALILPAGAAACSTCFGDPDSAMTDGMNKAILLLLGIVLAVQLGFVALFGSIWRRSRRLRLARERFQLVHGGLDG